MNYPDGQLIRVGDLIWWNEGSCIGFVQKVAESQDQWQTSGLNGPYISIATIHPFDPANGDVNYPATCLEDEGIGPLNEQEVALLHDVIIRVSRVAQNDLTRCPYSVFAKCVDGQMTEWVIEIHTGESARETVRLPWTDQ